MVNEASKIRCPEMCQGIFEWHLNFVRLRTILSDKKCNNLCTSTHHEVKTLCTGST